MGYKLTTSRSGTYGHYSYLDIDCPVRRSFSTSRTPRTANNSTDLFDLESQTKFRDLLEHQRKELSVFERNYILENQDIVDEMSNIDKVFDVDERERLQMEGQLVKHQYNMSKLALQRKQKKEREEFWKKRNRQKNEIMPYHEEIASTPYIQRPRSVALSQITTPRKIDSSMPDIVEVNGDDINFGNEAEKEKLENEKRSKIKIRERDEIKPITGTFLSNRYVNLSKANKIGKFAKPRKSIPKYPYSSSLRSPVTKISNDFSRVSQSPEITIGNEKLQ